MMFLALVPLPEAKMAIRFIRIRIRSCFVSGPESLQIIFQIILCRILNYTPAYSPAESLLLLYFPSPHTGDYMLHEGEQCPVHDCGTHDRHRNGGIFQNQTHDPGLLPSLKFYQATCEIKPGP